MLARGTAVYSLYILGAPFTLQTRSFCQGWTTSIVSYRTSCVARFAALQTEARESFRSARALFCSRQLGY
jgi:hypothetical protein